jgi:hypothetical protein
MSVGPAYPIFAGGLALFFAAQGAGYGVGPFLASSTRLLIIAAVGWLALDVFEGSLGDIYLVTAVAFVVSSLGILLMSRPVLWSPRPVTTTVTG